MKFHELKAEISREYLSAKQQRLSYESDLDDAKKLAVLDPYFDYDSVEISYNFFLQKELLYDRFLTYLREVTE